MVVKSIPEGYATYTPYYVVDGAAKFIGFLKEAFGAEERMRMPMPDGRLGHAEVQVGSSVIMLADGHPPEHPARKMNAMIYVNDVDTVYARALGAGAKGVRPPANQFYGDRVGTVVDQWGNDWSIGTHVEDVSDEEMKRRLTRQHP